MKKEKKYIYEYWIYFEDVVKKEKKNKEKNCVRYLHLISILFELY